MPAQLGPATTRRTAVAGAAAGLLASSCDVAEPRPDPASTPSATPPADPDALLVAKAAALASERLALASALRERYPGLAAELRPFVALHRAHAGALSSVEPPDPPGVSGGARRQAGLFRAGEAEAARRLARWAVAAESGALARLLASMSAGVAAHVAALAPDPGRVDG